MELTLILIFTFIIILFIGLITNSDFIDKLGTHLQSLGDTSMFVVIKEILLFPVLYLIPTLFVVIILIIVIVYMILNDVKYEESKVPKDMKMEKHTISLDEGRTLSERFTDIERDYNIKHYNDICHTTPIDKRKEFCLLFAKHDCNSIEC